MCLINNLTTVKLQNLVSKNLVNFYETEKLK